MLDENLFLFLSNTATVLSPGRRPGATWSRFNQPFVRSEEEADGGKKRTSVARARRRVEEVITEAAGARTVISYLY